MNDAEKVKNALHLKPDWYILKPPTRIKLIEEIEKVTGKTAKPIRASIPENNPDWDMQELDELLASMGF